MQWFKSNIIQYKFYFSRDRSPKSLQEPSSDPWEKYTTCIQAYPAKKWPDTIPGDQMEGKVVLRRNAGHGLEVRLRHIRAFWMFQSKLFFFKENSENSLHTRRFGGSDFVTIQLKKKKGERKLKGQYFFFKDSINRRWLMETLLNRRCMHIFHSFDQCAVYTMSQILFCKSGFSFLGVRYFWKMAF